jgi:hypothetical protein
MSANILKGKIWNPCYGTDKIAVISTVYGGSTCKDYILGKFSMNF